MGPYIAQARRAARKAAAAARKAAMFARDERDLHNFVHAIKTHTNTQGITAAAARADGH